MADTFTANYNLTKPQIGGDSNTWGTLINANFDTIDTQIKAANNAMFPAAKFPVGIIAMWSGSVASIPAHWAICNGANGTPNLQDRFIVAAGSSYAPGNTGGTTTNYLNASQLPSHSHGVSDPGHNHYVNDPGHSHSVNDPGHSHYLPQNIATQGSSYSQEGTNSRLFNYGSLNTNASGTGIWLSGSGTGIYLSGSGTGISIQASGSNAAVENRPLYYALCFIMYIG